MSNTNETLSIVVPVYNEGESIGALYTALARHLKDGLTWNVVFVNDGSRDNSLQELKKLAKRYQNVRVIALSRNFGKEVALAAGLHNTDADAVIMMDSDLQHPPRYLKQFIRKWRKGAQVVVGVRRSSGEDRLFKKVTSKIFYAVINRLSETELIPHSTDFRLIDREVVKAFNKMPEKDRITRGMIDWLGFERDFVHFDADERFAGEAAYSPAKLFQLALDSVTSLSNFPLRLASYLGMFITFSFGSLGLLMGIDKYLFNDNFQFSGPAMLATVIAFLVGVILINIGFVGLYVASISQHAKGRPLYVINKRDSENIGG